jgi:hypothetical protein
MTFLLIFILLIVLYNIPNIIQNTDILNYTRYGLYNYGPFTKKIDGDISPINNEEYLEIYGLTPKKYTRK